MHTDHTYFYKEQNFSHIYANSNNVVFLIMGGDGRKLKLGGWEIQ